MERTRPLAVWLAVAAMLSVGPIEASGKYVCTRGMAAAGPACPLCHGERQSNEAPSRDRGPCCTFVVASSLPMAAPAAFQLDRTLDNSHPCTQARDPARHVIRAEMTASTCAPRGAGPPSPPAHTTFLRL